MHDEARRASQAVERQRRRPSAATVALAGRAQTEARDPSGRKQQQDPLSRLKRRAEQALLNRLGPSLFDSSLTAGKLQADVIRELNELIKSEDIPLTDDERDRVVADITNEVLGYGPIEKYLTDPDVSEIMVNALEGVYVERDGKLYATDARFLSDDHLMRVIDRIVTPIGRRIDELSPMVDARLADGSRVNAIIPPLAIDGPALTIRKFSPAGVRALRPRRHGHAHERRGRVPQRLRDTAGPTSW